MQIVQYLNIVIGQVLFQIIFYLGVDVIIRGVDVDVSFNIILGWNILFLVVYVFGSVKGLVFCNIFDLVGFLVFNIDGVILLCNNGGEVLWVLKWNVILLLFYQWWVVEGLEGFVCGQLIYYLKNLWQGDIYDVDSYGLVNFYVGVWSEDGVWEVSVFVKNFFDDDMLFG